MTIYHSHISKGKKEDHNDVLLTAKKHQRRIKDSFSFAIGRIRSRYDEISMIAALEQRNVAAAIKASHVEDLEFLLNGIGIDQGELVFSDEIIRAYNSGAEMAAGLLPPAIGASLTYDSLGERSIRFLRESGAIMIREITESSKIGVTDTILRGFTDGLTTSQQTKGIREIVGLTQSQAKAVSNFRLQLEQQLKNPIDEFGNPLSMMAPDSRRLSATEQAEVRRHMKEGQFSQEKIDQMVNRYYESLQNKRANDISRTESLRAVNNGQLELWKQGLDQGVLDPITTKKTWLVTPDDKLRHDHRAIPIMNPKGVPINSFFNTPFGPVMGPGDGVTELINCRCALALVGV